MEGYYQIRRRKLEPSMQDLRFIIVYFDLLALKLNDKASVWFPKKPSVLPS